jgi:hypothetical protein
VKTQSFFQRLVSLPNSTAGSTGSYLGEGYLSAKTKVEALHSRLNAAVAIREDLGCPVFQDGGYHPTYLEYHSLLREYQQAVREFEITLTSIWAWEASGQTSNPGASKKNSTLISSPGPISPVFKKVTALLPKVLVSLPEIPMEDEDFI